MYYDVDMNHFLTTAPDLGAIQRLSTLSNNSANNNAIN